MRRLLMSATVFCLFVALVVPATHAAREVTITRVDPSTFLPLQPSGAAVGCQVGNTNPAAWAISNFIVPPEEYALVFDPLNSTCGNCGLGFQVTTINIQVQVTAASTIVMEGYLRSAGFPTDPSCAEPTNVECSTGLFTVDLPGAGGWIINLPIDCQCAFLNYPYALGIYIQSITGAVPDLITDNSPSLCTSYNDYGAGWVDLRAAYATWPGNLKIWADGVCCEQPVGAEDESMGELKGKFKNE